MKRRRPKLYLVGQDPSEVFDDLGKLRADLSTPIRRQRLTETFARIPHDKAFELFQRRIGRHAWIVLIELDRTILRAGGKNPVRLWSSRLRAVGVIGRARMQALRQLQAAGVIKVEQRGEGLSPHVTHLWYPRQD
jgi:hypothetical protein